MKVYLVVYDVSDDRRRARLAELLKDYGFRVQKSVFECRLEPAGLTEMQKRLATRIDRVRDSLLIYPLCHECRTGRTELGTGILGWNGNFLVL
jgi:CRISPR-associated protein Cas2